MNSRALALLPCLLLSLSMPATAAPCPPKIAETYPDLNEGCVCGKELSNLVVTLPPALTLVTACNLRVPGLNGVDVPIDITTTRVSLDRLDDNSPFPKGEFHFSGNIVLDGILKFDPGPAGYYWFTPTRRLIGKNTVLSKLLGRLKFRDEGPLEKLPVPQELAESACFTAHLSIRIQGMNLIIGEGDEAGAYPVAYRVMRASDFETCRGK